MRKHSAPCDHLSCFFDESGQPGCSASLPPFARSSRHRVPFEAHSSSVGLSVRRGKELGSARAVSLYIWRGRVGQRAADTASATAGQMKPYAALWFFVGVMCSASQLTAHSDACRTERQQCSPRNACCEGLACAPMFLDEKNPTLFYGNCLQSVPSSLSRTEHAKDERPPYTPRGPVLRDRQR